MINLTICYIKLSKYANVYNISYFCCSLIKNYCMFSYLKKYPLSLTIIAIVIYLSFFKPPHTDLDKIPNMDKLVHICMYLGISGMLWLEYLLKHRNKFNAKRIFFGAILAPILFSGCIELLQEYCTTYRGGDWLDFAANSFGVILASLIGYFILRPKLIQK
jgi:hypothetical protein